MNANDKRRKGERRTNAGDRRQADRRQSGSKRGAMLLAFGIMWAAITGYYVGLSSPMNPEVTDSHADTIELRIEWPSSDPTAVVPATSYADIAAAENSPNHDWTTRLATLKQDPYDPLAELEIDATQKPVSLADRDKLRAFNGAPPTIPHPIDQMTSRACFACHGEGLKAQSLRAAKMPHPFYANCTQCHVEQNSRHVELIDFRQNTFVGLPAPKAGARAFASAPPVVPHTTWLRNDCLSCHGRTASPGMETTHPWRKNCLQCHGSSSQLEQMNLGPTPQFLPPQSIEDSDE